MSEYHCIPSDHISRWQLVEQSLSLLHAPTFHIHVSQPGYNTCVPSTLNDLLMSTSALFFKFATTTLAHAFSTPYKSNRVWLQSPFNNALSFSSNSSFGSDSRSNYHLQVANGTLQHHTWVGVTALGGVGSSFDHRFTCPMSISTSDRKRFLNPNEMEEETHNWSKMELQSLSNVQQWFAKHGSFSVQ
jgi:hypothetical protein